MASGQSGKWFCHKLACLADYLQGDAGGSREGCYLELFAGPARANCPATGCAVDAPALRLLPARRFARLVLVVKDAEGARALARTLKPLDADHRTHIVPGSPLREATLRAVFDLIPRSTPALAVLDPPGYAALRWSTVRKLAQYGTDWKGHKMDLLIVLPVEMALLRNLARPACARSIARLYGGEDWQDIRARQAQGLPAARVRQELIDLYKEGLKGLGYKHVEDAAPARFTSPPYYHVLWASDRAGHLRELKEAWGKERYLPCEMFHTS